MRHDFVTIADLPKEKLMYLLEMAKEFENHPNRELLKGKGWRFHINCSDDNAIDCES